jgi:hypothetical protein
MRDMKIFMKPLFAPALEGYPDHRRVDIHTERTPSRNVKLLKKVNSQAHWRQFAADEDILRLAIELSL